MARRFLRVRSGASGGVLPLGTTGGCVAERSRGAGAGGGVNPGSGGTLSSPDKDDSIDSEPASSGTGGVSERVQSGAGTGGGVSERARSARSLAATRS